VLKCRGRPPKAVDPAIADSSHKGSAGGRPRKVKDTAQSDQPKCPVGRPHKAVSEIVRHFNPQPLRAAGVSTETWSSLNIC
jgi:hypothetical protein